MARVRHLQCEIEGRTVWAWRVRAWGLDCVGYFEPRGARPRIGRIRFGGVR